MEYITHEKTIQILTDQAKIEGSLHLIPKSTKLVIFAHGSGSSRFSPRNLYIAKFLQKHNLSTLLFDLLTSQEESKDNVTMEYRFNIELLTQRLIRVTKWSIENLNNSIGYFGSSTGAAAAFKAAAILKDVKAIVSRGGRPDLAIDTIENVQAASLLIVGGNDPDVLTLNQKAYERLKCKKKLVIISGASHLFEEPNKLEDVANLSEKWFTKYLK